VQGWSAEWTLQGQPLHDGDELELCLADGGWIRVTFRPQHEFMPGAVGPAIEVACLGSKHAIRARWQNGFEPNCGLVLRWPWRPK